MSWDICVYAEVRNDEKYPEWKPLIDKCVCDNFKYYNDGFTDELPRMKASDAAHPYVKSLNNQIYGGEFYVNYCSLKELRSHFSKIVDVFNTKLKAVYSALGVSTLCIDDDEYWCDEDEDADSNVDVSNANPWVKYMTFPVNKRMLNDLAMSIHQYNRALQMIGFCDTISSMCENYNDEVRLLFAIM